MLTWTSRKNLSYWHYNTALKLKILVYTHHMSWPSSALSQRADPAICASVTAVRHLSRASLQPVCAYRYSRMCPSLSVGLAHIKRLNLKQIAVYLPWPAAENTGTHDKPASWTMAKRPHAEIQPKNVPQGDKLEPVFSIFFHNEFWLLLLQSL